MSRSPASSSPAGPETLPGPDRGPTRFEDAEPVFVVGFPRSGTTLLHVMLHAHPRLALLAEVHYFDEILQIRRAVPSLRSAADFAEFLRLVRQCGHFRRLIDGERLLEAVSARLTHHPHRTYELFYRCLLEAYAGLKGAHRFGEKTPPNVRYLEELAAIFPRAKIVHILRDPRAVIASIYRMPWYPHEVVTNALKWYLDVRSARQFATTHPDTVLELRYEDLVADPARELRSVCAFLGEPFDSQMLEYHEGARDVVSLTHEPWSEGIAKPLYDQRVASWERELAPAEVYVIDRITGTHRERSGYSARPCGWRTRWRAPLVLAQSVKRYLPFKVRQIRLSRQGLGETGETGRLYAMLAGLLVRRRPPNPATSAPGPAPTPARRPLS